MLANVIGEKVIKRFTHFEIVNLFGQIPSLYSFLCRWDLTEEVHYLKMGKSLNNFVSYDIGQHILHEKKLVAKHLF